MRKQSTDRHLPLCITRRTRGVGRRLGLGSMLDGEASTPSKSSALEDFPPTERLHPSAKAVLTGSLFLFGLIDTLWHRKQYIASTKVKQQQGKSLS